MTYRDDRDADRARVEALEAELAAANRRIAELEGKQSTALVRTEDAALALVTAPRPSTKWLGAPIDLELMREFPGAFPTDQFEELIEPIRAIVREPGRTEILKSSMTWSASAGAKSTGPFLVATVSVRDGKTKLAVTDKLGQVAGAVFGGVGGGVGGGTVFLPLSIGLTFVPLLTPVFIGAWLGATYWGSRAIYKRVVRRRAKQLQRVFDALTDEIEKAIPRP